MTRRQIDAARERRLWVTQVVMPVVALIVAVPEARQAAIEKYKTVKETVKKKFGGEPKEEGS